MKKSIPIIRERESEAFILGNGREREFPLTPVLCKVDTGLVTSISHLLGIKALATNKDVLLVCFAYSISQVTMRQLSWSKKYDLLNQMFSDPENFSSIQGVMGSWLGVMVNQISPLGYNDQERETNEMLTLVLIILS